jgi:hypothetical protein
MTTTETPRDADGNPLCAWCGGPVPPSLGTKPRAYCKDGCKQRAYEARKLAQQLDEAREAVRAEEAEKRPQRLLNAYMKDRAEEAELRAAKSRDFGRSAVGTSRDDARSSERTSRDFPTKPQVETPVPPPAAPVDGEECPYCRYVVVGLVAHLRQCPDGPGAGTAGEPDGQPRRREA